MQFATRNATTANWRYFSTTAIVSGFPTVSRAQYRFRRYLTAMQSAKPFLRWAGSKRKQVATLSSFWQPRFRRYIEPFMGSACLYFAIRPPKAVLSDINPDLITTFRAVRDHPEAVASTLRTIPVDRESFNRVRAMLSSDLNPVEKAAFFIYLNRFCFNGLYRTNKEGAFNVPYGGSPGLRIPTGAELRAVAQLLKTCVITESDFLQALENADAGDFVYLDPPYAVGNRRVFRQYSPSSFGLGDLDRLAQALELLDHKGVKFLLSYARCPEATRYFGRWPRRRIVVQRNIAGFAEHRRRAGEILFSNCFPNDPSRQT